VDLRELVRSCLPGAQHVQAYPPDDGRQPGLHVLDAPRVLVADPKPCFLERIVGFAHRSEHAVGDRAQMPSVLLETFGKPLALIHRQRTSPAVWVVGERPPKGAVATELPAVVVGEVCGQSRHRQNEEADGPGEMVVAHS
jgi:hypothetical protein